MYLAPNQKKLWSAISQYVSMYDKNHLVPKYYCYTEKEIELQVFYIECV